MNIVLVIPPFTQVNTTYPSVTQLSGFLSSAGFNSLSVDLSLNVFLRIFSGIGLSEIYKEIKHIKTEDDELNIIINSFYRYIEVIDLVIEFLQGKNNALSTLLSKPGFIPIVKNYPGEEIDFNSFGNIGIIDRAKFYSSLMINDIYYVINNCLTKDFGLSRYAEKIAISPKSFDLIYNKLKNLPNIIEKIIIDETEKIINKYNPNLFCFSIPFPGNLYSALLSSKFIKEKYSDIKIAFGGGYVNTELRKLNDVRFFEFVDYLTFDDGELPLLNIINNQINNRKKEFVRTLIKESGKLIYYDNAEIKNISYKNLSKPNYSGIEVDKYVSILEMLNPMSRLWTDGYWNKLTIAHGCYWKKCTFCDITLDYIKTYSPTDTKRFVKIIKDITKETGKRTFHFTDEAAPPSKLKELAIELIKEKANICWWGNIRFDNAFSKDLCKLLALSGCIAVSGGIEIAEPRLLKLIEKGVTLEQAVKVTKNFRDANILVHAYLMYGFPSQTAQETINSLEYVRQFMKFGLINSAYWHRFSLTAHSPITQNPEKYGVKILSSLNNSFANNDLEFTDLTGIDHSIFTEGLNKALYNYMYNNGLDINVKNWFEFDIPKANVKPNFVENLLKLHKPELTIEENKTIIWNASIPKITDLGKGKVLLSITNLDTEGNWTVDKKTANFINQIANESALLINGKTIIFKDIVNNSKNTCNNFWGSNVWRELRENFLLVV
ncbi:MAG TPA: radical SAM protein [Melioribacteraceae bacterium]|nr:radical SAM protein [Melioribacteraceae bacterium]